VDTLVYSSDSILINGCYETTCRDKTPVKPTMLRFFFR
jgi:hypothetical protein